MMFRIAQTPKEKKQVATYWEQQRKIAADIRDEYERPQEEAYHAKMYNKILPEYFRPDFFSPLPRKNLKIISAIGWIK